MGTDSEKFKKPPKRIVVQSRVKAKREAESQKKNPGAAVNRAPPPSKKDKAPVSLREPRKKKKEKGGGGLSDDWKPRPARKGRTKDQMKNFGARAEEHRQHMAGRSDLAEILDTTMDELEVEVLEEGKLEGASQGDPNEVWLEISVLDERREQIVRQQEKMEGMNGLIAAMSGDKGGGKLGQSKGCCSACWRTMAMPYNMAKREVWVMVLNTPSMRKKVEEEGWVIYGKYPAVDVLKDEFDAIMLRESDVGRLYRTFETIDTDKSGEVSMKEMLRFLDLERNRFTETVFTIMDDDRNGSISFKEFVISAWNYCTLTHGTLVMFAFDLYDRDHSGFIDENEMELMLRDVYGDNFRDAAQCDTIVAMLEKMTRDAEREFKKVMIDHHDFADFCRRFPGMLYPAFTLQEKLRNGILGEKFWNEKSLARTYLSDGNYISASQLLALHIQRLGIKEFKSKYKDFEDQSTLNNALGRSGIVKHRRLAAGEDEAVVELTKEQKKDRSQWKMMIRKATRDVVGHHHHHRSGHGYGNSSSSDDSGSDSDDEPVLKLDEEEIKHRELIRKFQDIGSKALVITRGDGAFANGKEGIANGKILAVGATRRAAAPAAAAPAAVSLAAWS
jgi:Ca2+-binding EF-hand superfamily protein